MNKTNEELQKELIDVITKPVGIYIGYKEIGEKLSNSIKETGGISQEVFDEIDKTYGNAQNVLNETVKRVKEIKAQMDVNK